jgi:hypothetical protein
LLKRFHPGAIFIAVFLMGWANMFFPIVRTTSQLADEVIFTLLQLIPVGLLIHTARSRRFGLAALMGAFSLFSVPTALANCVIRTGWEQMGEVPIGHTRLRTYRLNGGATTSYSMIVRHEATVFPGIKIVRELFNEYRVYELGVSLEGHAAVLRPSDKIHWPHPINVPIRRFIYF